MPPATAKVNKTEFVTSHLRSNQTANAKEVNAAWVDAGNDGSISTTLVQKLRAELGLVGNLRPGRKAKDSSVAPRVTRKGPRAITRTRALSNASPRSAGTTGARQNILDEVEGDLDRLIFKLIALGGMEEVETALRRARREVVRSHGV